MSDVNGKDQGASGPTGMRLSAIVLRLSSAMALVAVAACSQTPSSSSRHSNIDPVWGVERAKKKVADGQPVPPGGGRYQVGKPYMVGGRMYFPREEPNYDKTGYASWYGGEDHGRETANGEVYDKGTLSAAHPTLPIPSYARVTNLENGRSVMVRINDRGPYVGNRLVDVSERAAQLLGFQSKGLSHVRLQYIGPAPVDGSDQRMLVASLRGPGAQASIAQDRALIAQRDRAPSDGRMTGMALANLEEKPNAQPLERSKPVVLASAAESDVSTEAEREPAHNRQEPQAPVRETALMMSVQKPIAAPPRSTWNAPPPPARPSIAIASTQPVTHSAASREIAPSREMAPSREAAPLPPHTLGTLTFRNPPPAPRPNYGGVGSGTASTLAPIGGTHQPQHAAPGAIGRNQPPPARRYEPTARVADSQGYMASLSDEPANAAIERLISANVGPGAARIDLGSYAKPENAARVAELMRSYGEVRSTPIVSGIGEKLTRVELIPSPGLSPGDVVSMANDMGIRSAAIRLE
jgi:rare lipoprotein A